MIYSSLPCEDLVRACAKSENADAWQEFICRFGKQINLAILRVARRYREMSASVIEDLVQETYTKVCADNCRLLRDFKPHHPNAFFGMLSVTATNVARDYFRARNSEKRGSGKTDSELVEAEMFIPDARAVGPDCIERRILLQEIDRSLISSVSPRDREIFWLHYRQGLAANTIAKIQDYGLTAKGVESILHRLRSQLRTILAQATTGVSHSQSKGEGVSENKTLLKGEGQL